MCIRPLNERSLKLSHQNSSFFQTTPKEDEIKEFHKRHFSQLICHQMKVLGKWSEKLFLLDTPFEVTRTTKHAISAEDSCCVSPLYERRNHIPPAGTLLGSLLLELVWAFRELGVLPRECPLPGLTLELTATNAAAGGILKALPQLPEKPSHSTTHIHPG